MDQKPSLFKKILYIIIGILLILISLISLILLLPKLLGLFSWDIPPINDSDLALEKIEIFPEKNAVYNLSKINDIMEHPENNELLSDHLSGKVWNEDFVKDILSKNEQALNYFEEAAEKESFQDPYFANPEKISLNQKLMTTGFWKDISRVSALKALSLLKQNKTEEAINEAFNSLEVSYKIQNSQGVLIEYLVAMNMKENGLNALIKIISSFNLSSSELKNIVIKLEKFHENEEGLIKAIKLEYLSDKLAIKALVEKDLEALEYSFGDEKETKKILKITQNKFYFLPNKTLEIFANQAKIEINNVSKTYSQTEAIEPLKILPYKWQEKYLFKNFFGESFYQIYSFERNVLVKKKCEEDLLVSITQLLIALKAYKLDNGSLPSSLNKLVPDYISLIPIDPFDGELIRYSPEEKIIYSVGEDLIDNKGSIGDNWREMSNPTFEISF